MDDDVLMRLLRALGWRVIRAAGLPRAARFIPEDQVVLLDADLSSSERDATLEWALEALNEAS